MYPHNTTELRVSDTQNFMRYNRRKLWLHVDRLTGFMALGTDWINHIHCLNEQPFNVSSKCSQVVIRRLSQFLYDERILIENKHSKAFNRHGKKIGTAQNSLGTVQRSRLFQWYRSFVSDEMDWSFSQVNYICLLSWHSNSAALETSGARSGVGTDRHDQHNLYPPIWRRCTSKTLLYQACAYSSSILLEPVARPVHALLLSVTKGRTLCLHFVGQLLHLQR